MAIARANIEIKASRAARARDRKWLKKLAARAHIYRTRSRRRIGRLRIRKPSVPVRAAKPFIYWESSGESGTDIEVDRLATMFRADPLVPGDGQFKDAAFF